MTNAAQPETVGESRKYWTHKVGTYPGPVAVTRMAQLIDFDDRLYETARIVYRFLISWYHDEHGDALMSMNHVSKTMKQRTPPGAIVPSRSAVHRAIIALMETGWVVRTFKGRCKGKGASRYVPVMNVLELAAQGKFPEPSHATGTVEPSHANGTMVSHATGTVGPEPSHATGIKTLPPDSAGEPKTGREDMDFAPPAPALVGSAAAKEGYDELFDAYGVRKEYAAGKVEYEKLAPSAELHAEMVLSAKAWRASAGGIERMHLARWLRERRYREDPKEGRGSPIPTSEPTSKRQAANDDSIDWLRGSPRLWPKGRHEGEFIEGKLDQRGGDQEMQLVFQRSDGATFRHHFHVSSSIQSVQDDGQKALHNILHALDMNAADDTEDLLFKPIAVVADGSSLTYLAVNDQMESIELHVAERREEPRLPADFVRPWSRPPVPVKRAPIDWSKYRCSPDDDDEEDAA